MANLNSKKAAFTVKISGSNTSGSETNFSKVSANQDLGTADILDSGNGVQGALTVGTSAVEVKVGASALSNRKHVTLFNNSSSIIYWGHTSGVTTSTGTPIFKNQPVEWVCGPNQPVYVIASSNGNDTRITESG